MLIVFEGIDGSGKGAQVRMLLSFLRQHKVKCKLHKYPTKRAKAAFAHLAGKKSVPPLELAGVFAGDIMAEQGKLRREINEGFLVICDRYLQSTLAYQGVKAGYGKLKARIGTMGALVPDVVILLDISPGAGAARKRRQKKPDRHEKDTAFLSAVRKNYLRMGRECFFSYKYAVLDASGEREKIFSDVVSQVEPIAIRKLEK